MKDLKHAGNQRFDLVVRGGKVVTGARAVLADIGVRDGRVVVIGQGVPPGDDEYDASGALVMPGGVDSHCHVEQMTAAGIMNADTWESASRAALFGGTTTIIPFAAQQRGDRLSAVVANYHDRASRGAMVDYAVHMILTDASDETLIEDLPPLIAAGNGSIKVFMTYDPLVLDDSALIAVLAAAKRGGAMVCVHAENSAMIKDATAQLVADGNTAPRFQADAHPRLAETEAIARIVALAEYTRQPVTIFHVSTAEGLGIIRDARARGVKIWAETCPQYLFLTRAALEASEGQGVKWICSPPLREEADQTALWVGLARGDLDLVSSDHAPFRFDDRGKLAGGPTPPFNKVPNGLPGLQWRMPLMMDAALRGKLPLTRVAELGSAAPARLFNLQSKGQIAIGADADLAIWDPEAEITVRDADVQDGTGYSPYAGMNLKGAVTAVFRRGEACLRDGQFLARPGDGAFLPRDGGSAALA